MKKLIVIYRTVFLLPSEAFIPSQLSGIYKFDFNIWFRDPFGDLMQNMADKSFCVVGKSSLIRRILFTIFGVAQIKQLPELIHAHFGPDAAMILPLAKRKKLPLVVTYHGFDAQQSRCSLLRSKKLSNLLYLLREKALFSYSSRILAVSEYLRQCLIKRGCPSEKLIVHYIGVDTEKFNVGFEPKLPNRIVNVSRHVEWKGVDTILRAMAILIKKYPDLQLVQIGSGSETKELLHLAEQLGVSRNIIWCGALPHESVLAELHRATLYVHASRKDSKGQTEAFGIALIEAQACGLPVLTTRSGGIPEAMVEYETGLMYEENDFNELALQVDKLLSSPETIVLMANNARNFVVNQFEVRSCSAKLEKIYEEVIDEYRVKE
ncbi:glycosyltransferase [Methylomonas sp. MK1]|uniref:glycosyltransferase n=1 Tax=Methylomonas sp. MK1 TaxID=1131552 RepID=UPI0003A9DFB0|nr:glycosyltransferase [Methylomonas sp. MK1]